MVCLPNLESKSLWLYIDNYRYTINLGVRPSLERAAEIWGPGRKIANRNLEAVHKKVGKRLLGASRSVPGAAVRGDLGWRKLEDRRELRGKADVWEEARKTRGQQTG